MGPELYFHGFRSVLGFRLFQGAREPLDDSVLEVEAQAVSAESPVKVIAELGKFLGNGDDRDFDLAKTVAVMLGWRDAARCHLFHLTPDLVPARFHCEEVGK